MARVFFALPIPAHIRHEILRMARPILPEHRFRVVSAENLHITMAFLGQVDDDELARAITLARLLDSPSTDETDHITITGAGAFPRLQKPRVVWLGIGDGADVLRDIHARLVEKLDAARLPCDAKPLRPHVTVAYLRKSRTRVGTEDADSLENAMTSLRRDASSRKWSFPLPEVKLYESRLLKTGAVYREL